ncbi:MAG: CotH kinase family protein [Lachnospiraceae bacterium]|nr:CotH kinase family protein [Lachnospiraceae bacterium]
MKRRKTKILLGASVLLLLLLAGVYCYEVYMDYRVPVAYTQRILGVPVVEDLTCLDGKACRTAPENPGVLFGRAPAPYTADGTLYVAQDFASPEWVGELTTDSRETFLCMQADEAWQDKAASIRDNHVFDLYLVEQDAYYPLRLVICGMPVMTLRTERVEAQDLGDYETDPDHFYFDPDEISFGELQVFNPATGVEGYEIFESGVRFYLRGDSSSSFEKKSYSLGLLDAKGENLDASLLGMRSDNSWKLKGMVADGKRIREKTACDIWEEFATTNTQVNESGPRMEYLELIVDNDYKGLYGIVEPVDAQKLELDKNDVLYKSTNWLVPEDEDIQYAVEHRWRLMTYMRVRYPDVINDYAKTWFPLRDYLNTFYHDGGDGRPAEEKIYVTNAVDMLLFNMTISGSDNHFRNLYFAADVSETGSYVMRQIPWDLDLTFGAIVGNGFQDDETVVYEEGAIPFLQGQNPEVYRPYLRERWQQVRESFLSTEHMEQMLQDNQDYLLQTGVMARENTRWPDYKMSTDLTRMTNLLERRMDWLDGYFAEY